MLLGTIEAGALAQHRQVMPITPIGAGPPLQRQAQQHMWRRRRQPQQGLARAGLQQRRGGLGIAGVDSFGQRADRPAEAPALAQHHGALGQRRSALHLLGRQALAGHRFDELRGGLPVAPSLGVAAKVAEHRAGLDRGQLVLVAEQDDAGMRRHGLKQRSHHLQVNHRRLVDDQQVQRQRVRSVGTESAAVGAGAQQRMQGACWADVRGQLAQ